MNCKSKDSIYLKYREKVEDFVFDDKVASVFDDMINRSVPGYAAVIAMSKVFAQRFAQENSNCYDLGCSLGAGAIAMREGIDKKNCRIIAVDNSAAMVEKCRQAVKVSQNETVIDVIEDDIARVEIKNASVVLLNFTLQFFEPQKRFELLRKIYNGMKAGGAVLLSEKIVFDDADENQFQVNMHHDFKKVCGYSDMEVSQKRKALENVLVPESIDEHYHRLAKAGFDSCYLWFQCFNFVSIVAFKK